MTPIDKKELLKVIIEKLEGQRKLLVDQANEAKEYSTNEESKAENKYDTRGLEASYLASGQSKRAKQMQEEIYKLSKVGLRKLSPTEPIGIGAIVQVEGDEGLIKNLFLLPVGGIDVIFNGLKVQTITIETPMGSQIYQQKVGTSFEVNDKEYEIVGVQ